MPAWRGRRAAHREERRGCPARWSGRVLGRAGRDPLGRLADGEQSGSLVIGDLDAVRVLQLHDQLDEIEGVGLEVLLEARAVLHPLRVDLQLRGQVLADALHHLVLGHWESKLPVGADRKTPADSRAAWVRLIMRSSWARWASRTALAMPSAVEPPWAITATPRRPRRIAPPTVLGSISSRSRPTRPRISSPPTLEMADEVTASRIARTTVREVPSIVFKAMLPVKPSVTTTSSSPPVRSLPSTLPTKFRPEPPPFGALPGAAASRSCASFTSGVPLPASSPLDRRPTLGRSTPRTTSMNAEPM